MELLGAEKIVVVAAPGHRFAAMDAVPLAELSCEPIVHYHPSNGNAVWVDEFAARRGVLLPLPALRADSPRTAAHLAAGMGWRSCPSPRSRRARTGRSGPSTRRNCAT